MNVATFSWMNFANFNCKIWQGKSGKMTIEFSTTNREEIDQFHSAFNQGLINQQVEAINIWEQTKMRPKTSWLFKPAMQNNDACIEDIDCL